MIEEAYEAVDAIEADDATHLREELGDVLEQVLLHAQIAADDGEFDIDGVCEGLNEKLVRRHPHVFKDPTVVGPTTSVDQVLDIWDGVKREERRAQAGAANEGEPGLLDSVPVSLPALMQCQKLSKRAAKAGFDWTGVADVWDQVERERREFEDEQHGSQAASEEFGDILFALVHGLLDADTPLGEPVFDHRPGDFHQYRVETMSGIPGVTITHRMVFLAAPMYPIDWLRSRIPPHTTPFSK